MCQNRKLNLRQGPTWTERKFRPISVRIPETSDHVCSWAWPIIQRQGPSRVSCIDVFISRCSGTERPGHCGVGSGLQWRLYLLCSTSSRPGVYSTLVYSSDAHFLSAISLIFSFGSFCDSFGFLSLVRWYWSDDERITATI